MVIQALQESGTHTRPTGTLSKTGLDSSLPYSPPYQQIPWHTVIWKLILVEQLDNRIKELQNHPKITKNYDAKYRY